MGKKKFKANPHTGSRIKATVSKSESPDHHPPVFSLRYLSRKFSISDCNTEEKAAFADTLYKLSQLPWVQLRQSARHGMGYEKISREAIQAGIPKHITEDVNFIAFRFHGMKPMVGYRDGHIFHILWLDRAFKLYKH